MPVQSAQFDVLAIQHEAFGRKARFAKTNAGGVFIGAVFDNNVIELRVAETPELNIAQVRRV